MEYGVYGDLIVIYPKPYSIYLRGTIIRTHHTLAMSVQRLLLNMGGVSSASSGPDMDCGKTR